MKDHAIGKGLPSTWAPLPVGDANHVRRLIEGSAMIDTDMPLSARPERIAKVDDCGILSAGRFLGPF